MENIRDTIEAFSAERGESADERLNKIDDLLLEGEGMLLMRPDGTVSQIIPSGSPMVALSLVFMMVAYMEADGGEVLGKVLQKTKEVVDEDPQSDLAKMLRRVAGSVLEYGLAEIQAEEIGKENMS